MVFRYTIVSITDEGKFLVHTRSSKEKEITNKFQELLKDDGDFELWKWSTAYPFWPGQEVWKSRKIQRWEEGKWVK